MALAAPWEDANNVASCYSTQNGVSYCISDMPACNCDAGLVRVYELIIGTGWTQLGDDISGTTASADSSMPVNVSCVTQASVRRAPYRGRALQ